MARLMDIFSENVLRSAFTKADPICTVCKEKPAIWYTTQGSMRTGFYAGQGHCADCYAEKANKGEKEVCVKG